MLVIFASSLLAVMGRGEAGLSAGLAGMAVSYTFEMMGLITWMVFMACQLETNSVALERVMEYWRRDRVPQEDDWYKQGAALTQSRAE